MVTLRMSKRVPLFAEHQLASQYFLVPFGLHQSILLAPAESKLAFERWWSIVTEFIISGVCSYQLALEIILLRGLRNAEPGWRFHRIVEMDTRILSRQTFPLQFGSPESLSLLTALTMPRICVAHNHNIGLVYNLRLITQVWIWLVPDLAFLNKCMVSKPRVCAIDLNSWRIRSNTPSHGSVANFQIAVRLPWIVQIFLDVNSLSITSNTIKKLSRLPFLIHKVILTTDITFAIACVLYDWAVLLHREVLLALEVCAAIMFPVVSARFRAVKENILAPVLWIWGLLRWRTHLFLRIILFKKI